MKICLWSGASFEQWYSSYHLIQELLSAMLKSGHEVWLFQMQNYDGKMPDILEKESNLHIINIRHKPVAKTNFVVRYLKGCLYFFKSAKRVRQVNKDCDGFDAVFLQSTNIALIPIMCTKKIHVPLLYNVQDIFPIDALTIGKLTKNNPAFKIMRWMQKKAYVNADRVVTISEDLKETIIKEGRKDVDVIYNWSYRNEPYDIPDSENHFLNTYGIKREDGFRVVYAGNIGQMIDIELFVQSAKLLKDINDIRFYIIGEGSGLNKLKSRVSEEQIDNIVFYDRQPMEYAPDNYCMADVNINPVPKGVMYTCMPSKTNTCLLSQKPTVVSMDLESDMAQRLSKVDKWTVVAPGDAKAMAEGILKYYNGTDWKSGESIKSKDSAEFIAKLGPVENAYEYVKILEEVAEKCV